ncbi:hypothetical protein ABE137_01130 [Brevibacillus laterosporus]|uniref:hypothetical protein n=1 Tax=Brevibacillus laterosporus TaxID=1465 RepID=UPI003D198152
MINKHTICKWGAMKVERLQKFTCLSCDYDFWIDKEQPPLPYKGDLFCPSCSKKVISNGTQVVIKSAFVSPSGERFTKIENNLKGD